jgi:hypothetical protein
MNRLVTESLSSAMNRPALKALARGLLHPFPSLSTRHYQLATTPDTVRTQSTSLPLVQDSALVATPLYKTGLGRFADPDGLANCIRQLQSGMSFDALAEELIASAEFQARHELSQKVDTEVLEALYCDGLGRKPDSEG